MNQTHTSTGRLLASPAILDLSVWGSLTPPQTKLPEMKNHMALIPIGLALSTEPGT